MRSLVPRTISQCGLAIGFLVALATVASQVPALAATLSIATPSQLPTASLDSAYSQRFTATGGTQPYTWQLSGTLPAGLTFAAASGVLSGTPTQTGTYPLTIKVTDKAGAQASASVSLLVVIGLTISTASVLPAAEIGAAYTMALQAIGGVTPYQWTVNSGALPAGLNLTGSGQITGTPRASGTFQFAALVKDANSDQATKQFSVTVAAALSVVTTSLPAGSPQSPYNQALTANGGEPPYSWSVTTGSLPAGLSLAAATGILSGTPTGSGTFTFTVTVADAGGGIARAQFTLTIAAAVTIASPPSLPNAMAGTAYIYTLQASGGQAPYTWAVSQGNLPGGLALNATSGQISGTPSGTGTSNFTVQVTDSAKNSATQVESLAVGASSIPAISIGGLSGTVQPLQQPQISVTLAVPFTAAIAGTLSLAFTPSGPNPMNDPAIQFSTGGRTASFTIAANATSATFSTPQLAVQTGSVEGSVTLSIASLQSGSSSLAIPSGSSQTAQVVAAPPAIQSMTVVHNTGGFQLQITAVADTRELTQASVTFQPAAGTSLQTSQLIVPLTSIANSWFQGSSSASYGGLFILTLPFTFSGNVSLGSISAVLTSSAGSSAAALANY